MDNFVTWGDLVQVGIFLTGFAGVLLALFTYINKKKK